MNNVIGKGKEVIRLEAEAVAALESRINGNFAKAVDMILSSTGRVIITGMGKTLFTSRVI